MHVSSHSHLGALPSSSTLQPALTKGGGGGSHARHASGTSNAQTTAGESAVANANVKGLYAYTLKNAATKVSDETDDESGAPDSSATEGDSTGAAQEDDSTATPEDNASTSLGLTYTARGVMSAAPSVAGGVFETIV